MRPPLVQAYVTMLPRLQAEETLATVNAMSVAMGLVKKADSRKFFDRLHRTIGGGRQRVRARTIEDLEAIGLTVKRTPKKVAGG